MSEKHAFRVSGVAHEPHCTEYKFDDSGALMGYCGLPVYHPIHALKAVEGEPQHTCPKCKHEIPKPQTSHYVPPLVGDSGFFACESFCDVCRAASSECVDDVPAPESSSQHVETEPPTPDHAFKSLLPKPNSKCDVCGVSGSIHGEPPAPPEPEKVDPPCPHPDCWHSKLGFTRVQLDALHAPQPEPPRKEQVEGAKDEAAVIAVRHIGHDEECPDCGRAEDAYLIDFPCSPPTAACTCDGEPLATAIRSALAAAQRENDELRALLKEAGAQRYHSDVCEIWHGEKDCNCGADALSARIAAALKEPQK